MSAPGDASPPADSVPASPPVAPAPAPPPRPVSPADIAAFDGLVHDSTTSVRSMASSWRTGLTALITLVTTGIIITGRSTAADIDKPWRVGITLAIGGGLLLALIGLWTALTAEIGARARLQSLDQIRANYASVEAYMVGEAAVAGQKLQKAKMLVAVALALLVGGVVATWWAPAEPTSPPAYLQVTQKGGMVTCGELQSADGGTVRLTVKGAHDPAAITLTKVTNMAIVAEC